MITAPRRRVPVGEQGSASVELAVIAPGLLLLVALLIAAARVALASNAIDGVAASAAREASLARTARQARHVAETSAHQSLIDQHLACEDTTITVDTAGFAVPLGRPAVVRVEVTCVVRLADLGLPGVPGSRALHDSFSSPLDPYRGRQP